jgi:nucleoside-diphosphate-sugar epimerase
VRVFLTGATGFLGGEVARLLRERGDQVRALVRDRDRAGTLLRSGCEVVEGDLSDEPALVQHCRGVQAVVHTAAVCDVGAPADRRETMVDVNVTGTERVLGAALSAGVAKAVHVTSVAVFGDTGGRVADEGWQRDAGSECASAGRGRSRPAGCPSSWCSPGRSTGPVSPGRCSGCWRASCRAG